MPQYPRLHNMLLHLQQCEYTIQCRPGKEMILADCLSLFPSYKERQPLTPHCHIYCLHFSGQYLTVIYGAAERDPIHSTIYRVTLNGWLDQYHAVPHSAHHFYKSRDKVSFTMASHQRQQDMDPS